MFDTFRSRAAAALAVGALLGATQPAHAQTWRTVTSARQRGAEKALDVHVQYGAGHLTVSPASAGLLYRFEMRYDEDKVRPLTEYSAASGTLRLGMEQRDCEGIRGIKRESRAAVSLSPDVPTALRLEFGAGDADLDLGGLSLSDVDISTGASETRISFGAPNRIAARRVKMAAGAASLNVSGLGNTGAPRFEFEGGMGHTTLDFGGRWTHSASATVEMGVGSVTLRLPRALGVRVTKDSFLSSFDGAGMVKRGDAWYSRNWATAPYKLTVDIDAALGSIDVVWID
jgi:hypothetical protein